jgi:protein involved in polysaccharide export with SLBB domain
MSAHAVPVALAADDVEQELARVSALLGITSGNLAELQRVYDEASSQVRGFTAEADGSFSIHFAGPCKLGDLLAQSLANNIVDHLEPRPSADVVDLVPPETLR